MGKIIYALMQSLDGYIEGPGGGSEMSGPGEELHRYFNEQMRRLAMELYGRRMYEIMRVWETYDQEPGVSEVEKEFAHAWRATPKVVFSTTLTEVGPNTRLVSGDIEAAVREIKAGTEGEISVSGAGLAASLGRLGLVDEYWLYLMPTVLGGGKPFFEAGLPLKLRPIGMERLPEDVVLLKYAA
jgi:dihydrofolate reductase